MSINTGLKENMAQSSENVSLPTRSGVEGRILHSYTNQLFNTNKINKYGILKLITQELYFFVKKKLKQIALLTFLRRNTNKYDFRHLLNACFYQCLDLYDNKLIFFCEKFT